MDTAFALETPEGTEIELRPAGVVVRGVALLTDELIRYGILILSALVLGIFGALGGGMFLIAVFLTYWGYGVFFEVFNHGQTPGKKMQEIQVLHDDGTPIGFSSSALRNLILIVDMLPLFYLVGLFSMFLNHRFQRLGDIAGGTMVVYRPAPKKEQTSISTGSVRAPLSLTSKERRVIVNFVERLPELSSARAQELASTLAPTLNCTPEQALQQVILVANGIRGNA